MCIFALLAIAGELKISFILKWFKFLAPFLSFGIFYIFLGLYLVLRKWWPCILVGCLAAGLGVLYIIVGVAGVERVEKKDKKSKDTSAPKESLPQV